MKILATADIHGSQYRLNLLLKNIEKYSPELVIICGDISQFGPGEMAKTLLDQIPVKTFAITGNIDTEDAGDAIEESKATNIEGKKVEQNSINFTGINKSISKQFIDDKKLIDQKTVLISHEPPYGFQDEVFLGKHAGDKKFREIIEKYKPRLVLCGHIHENPGYTKDDDTIVVNCSMGKRGEGAIIEINKAINVKMLG